jgi:hypothetical protein
MSLPIGADQLDRSSPCSGISIQDTDNSALGSVVHTCMDAAIAVETRHTNGSTLSSTSTRFFDLLTIQYLQRPLSHDRGTLRPCIRDPNKIHVHYIPRLMTGPGRQVPYFILLIRVAVYTLLHGLLQVQYIKIEYIVPAISIESLLTRNL